MQSTPAQGDKLSSGKPSMRERFNALLAEWGPLLLVVYFSIFAIVLIGFALAIKLGFGIGTAATDQQGGSWVGAAGTWGAAWVATKLTQPLRIAATVLITPPLGALLRRLRPRAPKPGDDAARDATEQQPGRGSVTPATSLDETPSGPS
jgi:hypothetical protein